MRARSFPCLIVLAMSFATAACGFHPLYGEIGDKPGGRSVFHSIYVESIPDEHLGYELRTNLIQELAGSDRQDDATYRLKIQTEAGSEGIAVEPDASVTRYNFNLVAHYELSNIRTGAIVTRGTETSLSEYDVVTSPYASLVAKQAAQKRATEDISSRIRVALAVFFHNQAK
jgi:LPS-assembly lipoprotein